MAKIKTCSMCFAAALLSGLALLAIAPAFGQEQTQVIDKTALEAERDKLFQQILADPANLDLLYAYAQVTIALGDFDAAIATYERILIFNADIPRVHMELGVLYFRQAAFVVAKIHLQIVADDERVPADVRAKANEFLAQINETEVTHKFYGSLFTGLRYQSNANNGPAAGTKVQIGFLPGLSEIGEGTGEADYSNLWSLTLNHSYDLGTNDFDSWDSQLSAFASFYKEQNQLNLGAVSFKTGPVLKNALGKGTTLHPFGDLSWIIIDDRTYQTAWGFGFNFDAVLNQDWSLSTEASYKQRRDQGSATDRNGGGLAASLTGRLTIGPDDLASATLSGSTTETRAPDKAFADAGLGLTYTHLFHETTDYLGGPLALTFTGGVKWTQYEMPDAIIEPTTVREDFEWRIGANAGFSPIDRWTLVFSAEYRKTQSTVALYDLDNLSFTAGIAYRF